MFKEYAELLKSWIVNTLKSRIFWLGVVCFAFLTALIVRLYNIQILNGSSYYETYVNKTKKDIYTSASRGLIYDRSGELLAGNEVTYDLTIKDTNEYTKTNGQYNEMLLRLIHIIERFDKSVVSELPVIIDESGNFIFSGSESSVRQLIRDVYGTSYIEEQSKKGTDVYSFDAETVMKKLMVTYQFTSKWGNADKISKEDTLALCNVRYAMRSTAFSKYKSTTICKDVSPELQAAILENQADLLGVEIEESTKRVYPDAVYFSNILGYTGKPSTDELETLKESDQTYEASDMIGKDGLEQFYELELSGTKGVDTVYVNNTGLVLDTIDSVAPNRGNDIYLTLDKDLTIAIYNIIEQQLAKVLADKLTIEDFKADATVLAGDYRISIKDVYYQMFSNNVIDYSHLREESASSAEQKIAALYDTESELAAEHILSELTSSDPAPMNLLSTDMQDYLSYIYDFLKEKAVITAGDIDINDTVFQQWKNSEISIRTFLEYAVSKGWIDTSRLSSDSRYSSSSQVYGLLTDYCRENIIDDRKFHMLVFRKLIDNDTLSGNLVCMALMDQGILEYNKSAYSQLEKGNAEDAFNYIKEKISDVSLTPAQIALDPCSASAVITDVSTGEIRALVSYPGYDLNKLSGTIDREYWNRLINDQSEPLYDKATQVRTAPGSIYKLITTAAGLEENVVQSDEIITCTGIFDKLDNPRCWIAREQEGGMHGPLTTVSAIAKSCNFYFYELGYRLSLNADQEYNSKLGLERLAEYASKFGFGEKSGVEIAENVSQISTEYPVTTAIGQGTNNFTTISISRYITALANKGTLYKYKLLDKVCDSDGNLIADKSPDASTIEGISQDTWDIIAEGMYGVTHIGGTVADLFNDFPIAIAGKSGSVQENLLRANHAEFISYAPFDNPEIAVAVSIPHGYMAYNAAVVTQYIYKYYFDYLSMDEILSNSYNTTSGSAAYSD